MALSPWTAKKKSMFNQVIGVQREGGTLYQALVSKGMLDKISKNINTDIKQADLIIIATPVAQIQNILKQSILHCLQNNCMIDGSTKSNT